MTKDEIIKLAHEAGLSDRELWTCGITAVQSFALACYEAGRTAEREECAKVCDSISQDQWSLYKGRPPYTGQELERASDYTQGKSAGADVCAEAIRARGKP